MMVALAGIALLALHPAAQSRPGQSLAACKCVITPQNANRVELIHTFTEHTAGAWIAVFSPDGSLLASCAQDRLIFVRGVNNLGSAMQLSGHLGWVLGLAFSPDGQLLASAGTDGFGGTLPGLIRLWDVATGTQVRVLPGHSNGCWSLDFQESSGVLVSGGRDALVKLWDPATGDLLRTLTGHSGIVLAVDFNPQQNLIASSGTDYSVRLWNSETGESVFVLTGHTNNVGFVKFSPDGTRLASSADDGTVRLWNVADGTEIWNRPAAQSWVNGVNFSPDGQLMLTCGHDRSVVLWETSAGYQLARLGGHMAPVLRGGFNPTGTMFATASWDCTVRVWAIRTSIDSSNHTPLEPAEGDSVLVRSYVTDCSGVADVDLVHYGLQTVPMFDDGAHGDGAAGDHVFGAFLPPAPGGMTVPYFISLTDSAGTTILDPPEAPDITYDYTVIACCEGRVGDANGSGDDAPTISDVSTLIDAKFIAGTCEGKIQCLTEADVNQSGGISPTCDDLTISDISSLIDYLFITGPETATLPECL